MPPEFSRRLAVARIGAGGVEQSVEADPAERLAVAARLDLPAVLSLACRFQVKPAEFADRGAFTACGRLTACVVRTCVVTLEDFQTTVQEDFALRFVPEAAGQQTSDDWLDPESVDEIVYRGSAIDLGEVTTEQLALALDPYPRAPGAALPDTEGADQDAALGAFAMLQPRH
jgi:uncharacterized metal-binding protein YceD (DUF177 family)